MMVIDRWMDDYKEKEDGRWRMEGEDVEYMNRKSRKAEIAEIEVSILIITIAIIIIIIIIIITRHRQCGSDSIHLPISKAFPSLLIFCCNVNSEYTRPRAAIVINR